MLIGYVRLNSCESLLFQSRNTWKIVEHVTVCDQRFKTVVFSGITYQFWRAILNAVQPVVGVHSEILNFLRKCTTRWLFITFNEKRYRKTNYIVQQSVKLVTQYSKIRVQYSIDACEFVSSVHIVLRYIRFIDICFFYTHFSIQRETEKGWYSKRKGINAFVPLRKDLTRCS